MQTNLTYAQAIMSRIDSLSKKAILNDCFKCSSRARAMTNPNRQSNKE